MFRWPISHSILFLLMVGKPFNVFLISSCIWKRNWVSLFLPILQNYSFNLQSKAERNQKLMWKLMWLNSTPYRMRAYTHSIVESMYYLKFQVENFSTMVRPKLSLNLTSAQATWYTVKIDCDECSTQIAKKKRDTFHMYAISVKRALKFPFDTLKNQICTHALY